MLATQNHVIRNPGPTSAIFPYPMQAPQPWANPSYYIGQIPPLNATPVQTFPITQNVWNNHQPATIYKPQQGNWMMQQPLNCQQTNQNLVGAARTLPPNFVDRRDAQATGRSGG